MNRPLLTVIFLSSYFPSRSFSVGISGWKNGIVFFVVDVVIGLVLRTCWAFCFGFTFGCPYYLFYFIFPSTMLITKNEEEGLIYWLAPNSEAT